MNTDVKKIAAYIKNIHGRAVFGIDGYIDEVWQVVDTRINKDECTIYNKMKQFGERIVGCGEGGVSNEILMKRRSYGGFTANTGNAAASLGVASTFVCMFGKERVDPVFEPFTGAADVISIGNPAMTNIFEFDDGKVMLPYVKNLLDLNWAAVTGAACYDRIAEAFLNADIIALGYWSGMPAFNEIVSRVCGDFVPGGKAKRMFFDFADTKKCEKKTLTDTFGVLGGLNNTIPMTLSLNEHEAADIFAFYGAPFKMDAETVCGQIENVRRQIFLDELIVHTPHFAAAASSSEGVTSVKQHYCEAPVRTTGAGDTFNGGYISACFGGLNLAERLAMANCTTGFFVRTGRAPDRNELIDEITARY